MSLGKTHWLSRVLVWFIIPRKLHDGKIVDWDIKLQYIIHTQMLLFNLVSFFSSNDGERSTVKKVQMIRRIPARCSGWDEAWSWITKIDCRTKYV